MTEAAAVARAVVDGARLAAEYNPLASLIAAAAAGLVAGAPRASRTQTAVAAAIVAGCWIFGDGIAVAGALSDVASAAPGAPAVGARLLVWALGGLLGGYVLPTATGVAVGRRVVFGTARLSAMVTGATTALVLSRLISGT
ncbi:MAG: hypothetical protein N3B11_04235 [Coriobacteriia bacterium]|nr:hypothetical protein [Coriobacteriia bacterium]